MDWLQFFASAIASLALPGALVISVLLLRSELIRLLRRVRRLKYGDAEAEFGEKLEEVEEDIAGLPTPAAPFHENELRRHKSANFEKFSNNSAVFISWLEVKSAILNLARSAKLLESNMPASRAAQFLLKNELIDHATYRAIRELQELRNIAVHPNDARLVTDEEAKRFGMLADKVAAVLEDRRLAIR